MQATQTRTVRGHRLSRVIVALVFLVGMLAFAATYLVSDPAGTDVSSKSTPQVPSINRPTDRPFRVIDESHVSPSPVTNRPTDRP